MTETARVRRAKEQLKLAEANANEARLRLERALRVLENAKVAPTEPEPGSIISFNVQFRENDSTTYQYAARRGSDDKWYVTNSSGSYTWDEMLDLMAKDATTRALGGRVQFTLYPRHLGERARVIGRQE
jgi:hypothetical protein